MKKIIFSTILISSALYSCSKEELKENFDDSLTIQHSTETNKTNYNFFSTENCNESDIVCIVTIANPGGSENDLFTAFENNTVDEYFETYHGFYSGILSTNILNGLINDEYKVSFLTQNNVKEFYGIHREGNVSERVLQFIKNE